MCVCVCVCVRACVRVRACVYVLRGGCISDGEVRIARPSLLCVRPFIRYGCKNISKPENSHAIVHGNAQGSAYHEIQWVPYSHQVPRFILWKTLAGVQHDSPKRILALASSQPTDGVSWQMSIAKQHTIEAYVAEATGRDVEPALHDAK